MRGSGIIAYSYRAENLCPACTIGALNENTPTGTEFDYLTDSVEEWLKQRAVELRIDYGDPHSYDSAAFPKPIFSTQAEEAEKCGGCGGGEIR